MLLVYFINFRYKFVQKKKPIKKIKCIIRIWLPTRMLQLRNRMGLQLAKLVGSVFWGKCITVWGDSRISPCKVEKIINIKTESNNWPAPPNKKFPIGKTAAAGWERKRTARRSARTWPFSSEDWGAARGSCSSKTLTNIYPGATPKIIRKPNENARPNTSRNWSRRRRAGTCLQTTRVASPVPLWTHLAWWPAATNPRTLCRLKKLARRIK